MKKLYTLSIALIASVGFAQTYIPFSGTGALNANGWTTHSGTAGQQTILTTPSDSGNSLSFPGLAASSGNRTSMIAGNTEDVNFPLTSSLAGTVYYSALIKVLDDTQLNLNTATGDYGLALTSVASATTTSFQARVYFKKGSVAGTFNVAVLNGPGGTAAPTYYTTDLPINVTYFLVVKYDFTANTASLFVNPVPGVAEPTATVTNATGTTAAPTQIAGFVIRQGGSATAGSGNIEIDEIRVSDNWAAVTPAGGTASTNQNSISGLSVYPNPVKNGVFFINSDANAERTVTIFDVLGKQVLNITTSQSAINVSSLNAGVYMVQINEEGNTATRKLVIE